MSRIRFTTFTEPLTGDGTRRVSAAWQSVNRQPSWIVRAALLAFFLVVAVPFLLLLLFALLAATVLFMFLWAGNAILGAFRGVLPSNREGRKNVRVIERRE